jgi:hypothetical protein
MTSTYKKEEQNDSPNYRGINLMEAVREAFIRVIK